MRKLYFIALMFFMHACEDIEDCETSDKIDYMILRFYDLENGDEKAVEFEVSLNENLLFVPDTSYTSLEIVLDADTTAVFIQFDSLNSEVEYSLSVSYDAEVSIFYPQCPPITFFKNLEILDHSFDSTSVTGSVTSSQFTTHVEIYL